MLQSKVVLFFDFNVRTKFIDVVYFNDFDLASVTTRNVKGGDSFLVLA